MSDLMHDYFEWLVSVVEADEYLDLCEYLFNTDFYYIVPMDDNRYADGISIRYKFGDHADIPNTVIAREIDNRPCSVFEMMVALASRMEDDIAYQERYGDRTSLWFKDMLKSLGLINMTDGRFNERRAEHIIEMFLERMYKENGEGGLFTLNYIPKDVDLRDVEIWYQANWYLNEVLK